MGGLFPCLCCGENRIVVRVVAIPAVTQILLVNELGIMSHAEYYVAKMWCSENIVANQTSSCDIRVCQTCLGLP
jgi:hypothetical protein